MILKKKEFFSILSLGVIFGFIVGLISGLNKVASNDYLHYRMLRSFALNLQESLNLWMILFTLVAAALTLLVLLTLSVIKILFVSKRKAALSQILEIRIKDTERAKTILVCLFSCLLVFLFGGWAINRHLLPGMFHPLSILGDVGIFLCTLTLSWILPKFVWKKMLSKTAVALVVLVVMVNLGILFDKKTNNPEGPNVILVLVDTLRADHLSSQGYARNKAPNIEKFFESSLLFNNAISQAPWTTPSIASIFTSQYPTNLGYGGEPVVVDESFLTLAEIFKENNYKTQGIISHTLVSSELGLHQGFQHYDEENAKGHGHISSPSIVRKGVTFLEKNKKNTFFLFLHFFDPHFDYILHEKYNYLPNYSGPLYSGQHIRDLLAKAPSMKTEDVEYLKALYDSEISFTDEYIGDFLEKVKELGLSENTMIIFTADHGEEFMERGNYWIGHDRTLFQEQIHVPLMIRLPGNSRGKSVDDYVGLIDLMPTIVFHAGLRMPQEYAHEGKIIDLDDEENLKNRIIISETERDASLQSVIWKGWKFIHDPEMNVKKLYNLKEDPAELENILSENETIHHAFEEILQEWSSYLKSEQSQIKTEKPRFTEEQKEKLRSLGYIK